MEQLGNQELNPALANVAMNRAVELGDSSSVPVRDETLPGNLEEQNRVEQRTVANVYTDPRGHTVTLLLDEVTANTVIYAIRILAAESEAHAREVRLVGATMPPDSYGAANRHAIASRHEHLARRLRVLERSYRETVTEPVESLRKRVGRVRTYPQEKGE